MGGVAHSLLTISHFASTLQPVADRTPTQNLASALLGEDVFDWLTHRRTSKPRWSYALLAEELDAATGGQVRVTGEAIRQWMLVLEGGAS